MSELQTMGPTTLAVITRLQDEMLKLPQIEAKTEQLLHGGLYIRALYLNAGEVIVGALIKIPTLLIVSGKTRVFTGADWLELSGYNVIPAHAGRKQIFIAHEDTAITMIFRTDATIVEQAEDEFTSESAALMSRRDKA